VGKAVWFGSGKGSCGVCCIGSCSISVGGMHQSELSRLWGGCQVKSTGSRLGAVVKVDSCVGDIGWEAAWCSGREGFGVIIGISSCSSEQNPSSICC